MKFKLKKKIRVIKPVTYMKQETIWFGILTIWSLIAGIYILIFQKEFWFMAVYLFLGFITQIFTWIGLYQQYLNLKEAEENSRKLELEMEGIIKIQGDETNEKPDYVG